MSRFKIIFFIFFLFVYSKMVFSQDITIYPKKMEDNLKILTIPPEMTYHDFKILTTDIKMKDYIFSAIMPGYIHFKIEEKKKAYTILGLRVLSYSTFLFSYFKLRSKGENFLSLAIDIFKNNTLPQEEYSISLSDIIYFLSFTTIIGTYFYDILDGEYSLEKKKSYIRYKFFMKKSIEEKLYGGKIEVIGNF